MIGGDKLPMTTGERFDLSKNMWIMIRDMNVRRSAHAIVAVKGMCKSWKDFQHLANVITHVFKGSASRTGWGSLNYNQLQDFIRPYKEHEIL